jgi:hypothetical protein
MVLASTASVSSRWAGPFSTGPCYKLVLKGSLAPGRKKTEAFGDFGHRPMPQLTATKKIYFLKPLVYIMGFKKRK